jgi:hypothetical protein
MPPLRGLLLHRRVQDAADPDLEDPARPFPVVYSADEMPDLAYSIERGRRTLRYRIHLAIKGRRKGGDI